MRVCVTTACCILLLGTDVTPTSPQSSKSNTRFTWARARSWTDNGAGHGNAMPLQLGQTWLPSGWDFHNFGRLLQHRRLLLVKSASPGPGMTICWHLGHILAPLAPSVNWFGLYLQQLRLSVTTAGSTIPQQAGQTRLPSVPTCQSFGW